MMTRERLSDTRSGLTRKFKACGYEIYVTVNFYENGKPGEVFGTIAKEGSVISGFVDALFITLSIALQYGVPLEVLIDKYRHTRFDPMDDDNSSLVHAIAVQIESLAEEHMSLWGEKDE